MVCISDRPENKNQRDEEVYMGAFRVGCGSVVWI